MHIEKLLANAYSYGDYDLPTSIPIVPIRTTMKTYLELPDDAAAQRAAQLAKLALAEERVRPTVPDGASAVPVVEPAARSSEERL
ncbi:hypothetical protein L916_09228 [Phytophthora nicotianae]|uniref:Uncharacterized protein n=1 Tax=Phytophthora nicotianae TaxID=4792 RepID=W2IZ63_PHYNI|nr:hypothetical protein L916_09228 [Phytophthora nicotianae]